LEGPNPLNVRSNTNPQIQSPKAILTVCILAEASAVPLKADVAEPARLTVQVDSPGHAVPPTLHGLFFEDINHGADGGLYAEMVQEPLTTLRIPGK
jgi:hypothetical protein